jgi:diguanylate cyclase (GGDEF)-like protein/PAS domain S-box-containing protein
VGGRSSDHVVARAIGGSPRRATPRATSEDPERASAILEATAFAVERLVAIDGLEIGLDEVLARLGEATGADRVYTYRNGLDERGRRTMSIDREWTAPGVAPTIHDPENQDYPYADGFLHWERRMSRGSPVQMTRSRAGEIERRDMESEDIASLLVVPIFVDGEWWGFVGFDDCRHERRWSRSELEALRATASVLGAAISADRARRAMAETERRFQTLAENLPAVVYIDALDEAASTIYISPVIEQMLGYSPEEWIGDRELFPKVLHPEDREAVLRANDEHNRTGRPFRMEYRMIAKDGRIVWVRDEALVVHGEDGRPTYSQGILQDITERKAADERIAYLSYHDHLTGLANQTMFVEVGNLALARARRGAMGVAVLYLDIDGFKLVNEALGPEAGDRLLRQVAERLTVAVRDTDTVARRGADEFLLLLSDLSGGEPDETSAPLAYAETVATRIQERLGAPFVVDGTELILSASVGICMGPRDDSDDIVDLVHLAEAAMLGAKRLGPGGRAVSGARSPEIETKLAFATRLRKAVAAREWELHYQPVVELATGRVVGVEALIRWRNPEGELIPPSEFLPLAEELGLMDDIDTWVVEELARQDAIWAKEGIELEIGFNLSPRQFAKEEIATRILSPFEAMNVDLDRVVVEITESSAMRDPDRAEALLTHLHRRGIRLAIDDFGTGYSSLSRLRQLPIDVLKIDRSFIHEIDRDPEAARIVSAFVQLGRGLGMRTLAEGIETARERDLLVEVGCELGQGYLFCRPLPARELTDRLRTDRFLPLDRVGSTGRA